MKEIRKRARKIASHAGVLMISAVAFHTAAIGQPPPDPHEWQPTQALAARVDAIATKAALPAEFGLLTNYRRYYSGTEQEGRKVVIGIMISPEAPGSDFRTPGLYIVRAKEAPAIADGGCTVVSVVYDVAEGKILEQLCNYDLQMPPPPRGRR